MNLIDRLRALSRHEHDDLTIGDEAADETERLLAERDGLQADAARYRWLRDIDDDPVCSLPQLFTETGLSADVDAAIDAARKGHK
jgi:hypothetical protein